MVYFVTLLGVIVALIRMDVHFFNILGKQKISYRFYQWELLVLSKKKNMIIMKRELQLYSYFVTFIHYSCLMFLPSHNVCSNLQLFLSIMFVLVQVSNHKFSKFDHNTLHSYFSTTSSFFKRVNLESSFEDLR